MTEKKVPNYFKALDQAEAGRVIRDHLKHMDFGDHLIDVIAKRADFAKLVITVLWNSSRFWGWLIGLGLSTSLFVVKFPELAAWICNFISKPAP